MLRRVRDLPARFPSNIEDPLRNGQKAAGGKKKQTNCGDVVEILNETVMCETYFFFLTVVRREGRSFEARGDVKHPVSRQASCFASSFFASTRGIGSDTLDSQTFTVGGQK